MWVFYLIFHRNLESRFSKTDFLVFSYFQNFSTLNHFTRGALKCTFCFSFSACWPLSSFTAQHHYVCLALSADGRLSLTHTHMCQWRCFHPPFHNFLLMQFLPFLFRLDSCSSSSLCYLCRSFQPLLSPMSWDYWCPWTAFYDLYLNISESILLCDTVVNINHFVIYIGDEAFLYSPSYPGTHSAAQVGLKSRHISFLTFLHDENIDVYHHTQLAIIHFK